MGGPWSGCTESWRGRVSTKAVQTNLILFILFILFKAAMAGLRASGTFSGFVRFFGTGV